MRLDKMWVVVKVIYDSHDNFSWILKFMRLDFGQM